MTSQHADRIAVFSREFVFSHSFTYDVAAVEWLFVKNVVHSISLHISIGI